MCFCVVFPMAIHVNGSMTLHMAGDLLHCGPVLLVCLWGSPSLTLPLNLPCSSCSQKQSNYSIFPGNITRVNSPSPKIWLAQSIHLIRRKRDSFKRVPGVAALRITFPHCCWIKYMHWESPAEELWKSAATWRSYCAYARASLWGRSSRSATLIIL